MLPLIDGALGLIKAIVDHLNLSEARKYIDKVYELKSDILEEESKGPDKIDDAKLESLYGQLKIAMEAMQASVLQGMPKP